MNDIWGATTMEWNKTVWESDLDIGLRMLRLGVDTHAITSHFALPLLIQTARAAWSSRSTTAPTSTTPPTTGSRSSTTSPRPR